MTGTAAGRTYEVRTYGCQMNVHDSERLTGLLEEAGYVAAPDGDDADVVVFNTCAVRENADNKLYGNLGHLAPIKAKKPGMQIAVGGCLAQKDRSTITEKAPWVDVVFGTHNIGSLPVLLERARVQEEAQVEILESLEVFPSTLPTKRESAYAAWVSISVGCNNTCTFCIVPALRGKEKDRRPGEILAEIEALVAEGVSEVTLLGQNVNAYGVEFGDRQAFSKLLRACGEVEGLERVRFTSPHPAEFTDDVIEAMAETPNVMPSLHMPLQSGSDRVLRAMRRSYRQSRYLGIIDRVRAAMPEAAITTDIIVGFPGETEEDFEATLDVVRRARFSGAFTFQYSKRPGTPAATLEEQVPKAVVQERYERLVEVVNEIAWEENRALEGRTVELLVAEGEGRKDAATHRLSGRARDNRLVHFTPVSARTARRSRYARATWSRSSSRTALRTTSSPTGPCARSVVRAPVTPGRLAPPSSPPASRSACPPSAFPPRSRPRTPAPADPLPARGSPRPAHANVTVESAGAVGRPARDIRMSRPLGGPAHPEGRTSSGRRLVRRVDVLLFLVELLGVLDLVGNVLLLDLRRARLVGSGQGHVVLLGVHPVGRPAGAWVRGRVHLRLRLLAGLLARRWSLTRSLLSRVGRPGRRPPRGRCRARVAAATGRWAPGSGHPRNLLSPSDRWAPSARWARSARRVGGPVGPVGCEGSVSGSGAGGAGVLEVSRSPALSRSFTSVLLVVDLRAPAPYPTTPLPN